tara:strand:+ start:22263 stop:23171 length:909 start_codon:yes stop_codon:yes gene_type:complete
MKKPSTLINILLITSVLFGKESYRVLETPFHLRTLSMSGTGVSDSKGLDASSMNPALLSRGGNSWQVSIIKHPADINSMMIEKTSVIGKSHRSFTLKHMDYGNFVERDENQNEIGEFSAGDTWLSASLSRSLFSFLDGGFSAGLLNSHIDNVSSSVFLISLGVSWELKRFETVVGISVKNKGFIIQNYTDYAEDLPSSVAAGISKRLAHLPLQFLLEGEWWPGNKKGVIKIGGEFSLSHGMFFRWGTSTYRIDQSTGDLSNDILTASSVGFGLTIQKMSVDIGLQNNGIGGIVSGVGFSLLK